MTGIWSDLILWIGFGLLIAVAALMVVRRLYREFPLLFAYFVVEVIAGIVARSFLLHFSAFSIQYFYAYWLTEALRVLAAFAVLYEVFLIRLFPSFHTTPVYRYLFPAVIILGVVLAVIMFLSAPQHGPNVLSVLVGEITLALNVLQVALLLFFFLIVLVMGRGWEWHEFGIALGYGVYALSKLVTTAVRAKAGYARTSVDQLPTIGYFAALVIWIVYLWRKYKPPDVDIPMEIVHKAQSWDKLLRDVTGRRR
jgi:hypothetical protein